MEVRASLDKYRRSATKIREITRVLKGMDVIEANFQLENLAKGYAEDLKKLLASAVANAKNNHNLKEEGLLIKEVIVQPKPMMKRWRPRAHGRAAQILKRTSRVEIVLEETEEAEKTRKARDKKRIKDAKKTTEVDVKKNHQGDKGNDGGVNDENKKGDRADIVPTSSSEIVAKQDKKFSKIRNIGSGAKKIFRRKSI